ncbi:HAD domain-containing protein [Paraburkholderia hospita]|uniref:HAD domain-containing protein n=1 Tax=Paraburkholderia hospita TaxID=169430 RepID=UPI000271BEB8|nr:HAD domain-containing protein [Paraburkholderia hospita]EUC16533.1 hypothetical protein PMI06_004867 [Burkholderia sp. BT03]SKC77775.1 hypothetical protein SAMN06266956_3144 [Paraburkholderia hospita]
MTGKREVDGSKAAPTAQLSSNAHVIFLDIDNSLHAADAYVVGDRVVSGSPAVQLFQFAHILEAMLEPYPAAVIILSSSWVPALGFEFTVAQLPLDTLRARVRGATFEQADALNTIWRRLTRGAQILRFVRRHRTHHWLAIDDDRSGFVGYESHLVHCQVGVGLGDKDVQQLFARRLELMFGPPDSLSHTGASTPERLT